MSDHIYEEERCGSEDWQDLAHAPRLERTKEFLTLRAMLALAGHCLYRTPFDDGPDTYFVTRGHQVRRLNHLGDVWNFAHDVGTHK